MNRTVTIFGKEYVALSILDQKFRARHRMPDTPCYGCAMLRGDEFEEDGVSHCVLTKTTEPTPSCNTPLNVVFVEPERAHEHEVLLQLKEMGL